MRGFPLVEEILVVRIINGRMQSRGAAVDFSSVSEYNKDEEVDALCDKVYTIDEIRAIATPIAKSHGVAALYLFGSYARGDATSESDLDFRIEKGQIRTLFQLGSLLCDLEDGFQKNAEDVYKRQVRRPVALASSCRRRLALWQEYARRMEDHYGEQPGYRSSG